jgi:CBS domain containing-hemolysin-like protein
MESMGWLILGIVIGVLGTGGVRALIARLPRSKADSEETLAEEIRTIVSEGERDGLLEEEARDMIEGVFELGDAVVLDIMTPRTEMVSFPAESSWDEIVKFAAAAGHSRIPISGKSRDEIVGLLHIKDLLLELAQPTTARRPLRAILRKPYFVREITWR